MVNEARFMLGWRERVKHEYRMPIRGMDADDSDEDADKLCGDVDGGRGNTAHRGQEHTGGALRQPTSTDDNGSVRRRLKGTIGAGPDNYSRLLRANQKHEKHLLGEQQQRQQMFAFPSPTGQGASRVVHSDSDRPAGLSKNPTATSGAGLSPRGGLRAQKRLVHRNHPEQDLLFHVSDVDVSPPRRMWMVSENRGSYLPQSNSGGEERHGLPSIPQPPPLLSTAAVPSATALIEANDGGNHPGVTAPLSSGGSARSSLPSTPRGGTPRVSTPRVAPMTPGGRSSRSGGSSRAVGRGGVSAQLLNEQNVLLRQQLEEDRRRFSTLERMLREEHSSRLQMLERIDQLAARVPQPPVLPSPSSAPDHRPSTSSTPSQRSVRAGKAAGKLGVSTPPNGRRRRAPMMAEEANSSPRFAIY